MRFFLGTHMPSWLRILDVPLFICHRRMVRYRTLPIARGLWALDSGGFTELKDYGAWRIGPDEYITAVRRYRDEIGQLVWAAPQDWMCEPAVIAGGTFAGQHFVGTHLSVAEHQCRTVENFLYLRDNAPDLPFIPVLQGWRMQDYLDCVARYEQAGVDLASYPVVGLGSVCRRQATDEIGEITATLLERGMRLHGFGVKKQGLDMYAAHLTSADSLAWSDGGRKEPGCTPTHKTEANCLRYATAWRAGVLAAIARGVRRPYQPQLFEIAAP